MRYGIIGSRTFVDYEKLKEVLDRHKFISQIISGGAPGADSLAADYAHENSIPLLEFFPDWAKYPRTGGFVRNKQIVRSSDVIIAFWDNVSSGTKNSLDYAKKLNIKSIVISFNTEITPNEEINLWQN